MASGAYGKPPTARPSMRGGGGDADLYDKYMEETNVKGFVELLKSQQPLAPFEERLHPWAEDPKTIGALAATQLAMLAHPMSSPTDSPLSKIQEEVREAGGLQELVSFLKSKETDRVQNAVVALNFLTQDNDGETGNSGSLNAKIVEEAGAMPELLELMNSKTRGLSGTAAATISNLCYNNEQAKASFYKMGGMASLVGLLSADLPNHEIVEVVICLHDMIEDEDGSVQKPWAQKAMEAGAEQALERVMVKAGDDNELKSEAQEALVNLKQAATAPS